MNLSVHFMFLWPSSRFPRPSKQQDPCHCSRVCGSPWNRALVSADRSLRAPARTDLSRNPDSLDHQLIIFWNSGSSVGRRKYGDELEELDGRERGIRTALVDRDWDVSRCPGVGGVAVGLVGGIVSAPDPDPDDEVRIGCARSPGEGVADGPVLQHGPGRTIPEPPLELIGHRAA